MQQKNKNRCRMRLSGNKQCRRVTLSDGYCAQHQNQPLDIKFWQDQPEEQRLEYLQKLAELRAINAHKTADENDKSSDLIFNRNLRIAASISKLRHVLADRPVGTGDDKWLELLQGEHDEAKE
ncbi:MAG: hypothetical protein ACK5LE_00145 [Alphaproteobacteria bacterium]